MSQATPATAANRETQRTLYEWEGTDKKGSKIRGTMSAQSVDLIKAKLRRQGILPTKIKKQSKKKGGGEKINAGDIAIFARQLTTMMQSGIPMVQSLEIVAQGLEKKSMRDMVFAIKADVESGSNFASALTKFPDQFDDLFCSLVDAGEQSGTLDTLLNEIANYKEKTEALRKKIKKAMTYPISVLVIASIVTGILLIFVVPQFETLFKSVGSDLPAFTKFVVTLSEGMQKWWYVVIIGVGLIVYSFKKARKVSKPFNRLIDQISLKLPVFGPIMIKAATARFSRTLSTMSRAGVPIVEAMENVAGTAGNEIFKEAILKMKDEAATGQRLQISIAQSGLFSTMVIQMVAIGEEAGSIDEMLGKVAEFYEGEVDNDVDALTSLMEPIIMAFLGIVIGGLVLAMYLPIFKMGEAF
ncbi:MAG: type II secretion system F family protein [Gammaproteobacteria bacterium]|nr:type II secretion system F family protein [Gammaproteobacteria bacterium]